MVPVLSLENSLLAAFGCEWDAGAAFKIWIVPERTIDG